MAMHTIEPSGSLRVILCFSFRRHASHHEVNALKQDLIGRPCVNHAVELSGTFDFIVEATLDNFHCYNEFLKEMADPIARIVERFETSFICRRFVRKLQSSERGCIWVPHERGHIRIDHADIDKVTAESDYMRIHCHGQSYLLHSTMRALHDQLGHEDFILLHRSVLVRLDFIERLIHKEKRWIARLADGTEQNIARSHATRVLGVVKGHSPTTDVKSSNTNQIAEPMLITIEDR